MIDVPLLIVRVACRLVPGRDRREWLAEWTAELAHVKSHRPELAARFACGAITDAFVLWRIERCASDRIAALQVSLYVAATIVTATWLAQHLGPGEAMAHGISLAAVPLVASTATSFDVKLRGDVNQVFWWIYLSCKLAALVLAIHCLGAKLSGTPLAPIAGQFLIASDVLVIRWALDDQRKRCPVCYRRLALPVRIGSRASTLLDWFGTELMCPLEHGVLLEPESLARCCSERRWIHF